MNLQIIPTWEKGVQKSYHTEDHQIDFNRVSDLNTSRVFDTSTGDITHETPKKQQKTKPKPKDSENICRICRIGNQETRNMILSGLVVWEKDASVKKSAP